MPLLILFHLNSGNNCVPVHNLWQDMCTPMCIVSDESGYPKLYFSLACDFIFWMWWLLPFRKNTTQVLGIQTITRFSVGCMIALIVQNYCFQLPSVQLNLFLSREWWPACRIRIAVGFLVLNIIIEGSWLPISY